MAGFCRIASRLLRRCSGSRVRFDARVPALSNLDVNHLIPKRVSSSERGVLEQMEEDNKEVAVESALSVSDFEATTISFTEAEGFRPMRLLGRPSTLLLVDVDVSGRILHDVVPIVLDAQAGAIRYCDGAVSVDGVHQVGVAALVHRGLGILAVWMN